MAEERNFLFVLSPNAGILDSWLPVLDRLAQTPQVRIHALLPRPEATLKLRSSDFMVRCSMRTFASVHFCRPDGRWAQTRNLVKARQKLALSNRMRSAQRLNPLSRQRARGDSTPRQDVTRTYLERIGLHRAEALLCDISEHRKPYFAALLRATPEIPIHSVSQGIFLREVAGERPLSSRQLLPDWLRGRMATQFLMGASEDSFYRPRFGLSSRQLCLAGIFRHDPEWLDRMHGPAPEHDMTPGTYVFLASRPSSPRYLPQAEKRRVIRMVHEAARTRGLTLVVRRHPFEGSKREFERLIGKAGKRNGWLETARHPLDVGAECALAVTLNSSVAIDMAAMSVPVVEPIDYTGYPEDAPNIRLDENGRQTSVFTQSGIAIGASSEAELASAMDRLLGRRQRARTGASAAYRALYAEPAGSIDHAARRMLE